jgi:CheY-like chemotaxis protein
VDDEPAIRDLLTQWLGRFGFSVVCAEGGVEVLDFSPINASILS